MTPDTFAHDLVAQRKSLMGHAFKLCRDEDKAEDLVADTIARAWRYKDSFTPVSDGPDNGLKAWLHVILRSIHLSGRRRLKWDGGYLEDLRMVFPVPGAQEAAVELHYLRRALAAMSPEMVRAVVLRGLGASEEEAAAELGICAGTVKSRTGRGRAHLRKLFA